jgi:hypothetical protein
MKITKLLAHIAVAAVLGTTAVRAASITNSTDISGNVTWYSTNTYYLQKVVYVLTNASLTIQPGTVIKAMTTNLIGTASIPTDCSALWVCRGGKLYATGTVTAPIIFTFDGDDVNNPNDVPYNTMGKWGGIVLCGKAQINSASDATGNTSTPKYEVFEGTTVASDAKNMFGGSDDSDSSGELRYVSIRYPGIVFAPAKELNGLSLGGVGNGTVIEYVEVFNSADDGFEFFGGNVNTKHLIAAFCDDDDFDTDMGYRGTNQFWFGIKPTWTGSSDSRGFETDGDLSQTGYPGNNASPISSWVVHNATLIGRGTNVTSFGGGVGWMPRDEARPNVFNSIFTDFAEAIRPETDWTNEVATAVSDIRNSIFYVGNTTTFSPTPAFSIGFLWSDAGRTNTLQSALLGGVSYTNNGTLNPRPQAGSPALSNVAAQGAGLTPTSYRGAFGQYDNWANGWSALSQMGNLVGTTNAPSNPNQPLVSTTHSGGNLKMVSSTEVGFSYQLQSTTNLINAVWTDEGSAVAGTGGSVTSSVPSAAGIKFFRVKVQ